MNGEVQSRKPAASTRQLKVVSGSFEAKLNEGLGLVEVEPGAGPDEVFIRAERLLGRNGIAEVLALLGYYSSVAMAVKLHRVPVPA